jgi:hypothetical protein
MQFPLFEDYHLPSPSQTWPSRATQVIAHLLGLNPLQGGFQILRPLFLDSCYYRFAHFSL